MGHYYAMGDRCQRRACKRGGCALAALIAFGLWNYAGAGHAFDAGDLETLLASGKCPGCDLRGADLRNRDLRGAQLEAADLRDAQLTGSSLAGANLRGARLTGVELHEVRLTGADLRDADLSHLHIDRDLEFLDLTGVLLEGARFSGGRRCGPLPEIGGWGCSTP